ncbi:unnamed protein product [Gongylonema pulchrum]|uniref:Mediator of RNA polymerase II transcription subunit 6 n=1 Tax=Gongylonema pulchrum TaxID=637853 RepID=A0A183E5Z8_9BILA|nr:unnamed protein product [Gongylonema pulchrum]
MMQQQSAGAGRGMMMGQTQAHTGGGYMGMPNVPSQSGPTAPVSLLHQSFRNPNWPPNFITPDNVLDYFCDPGNVFYDVSSCNQHIKMQNLNRPLHECLQ